jgi:type I restriction enzyme S subunit
MIKKGLLKDLVIDMHQGINTVTEKVEYLESGVPILQSKHITKGYLNLEDTKYLSNNAYLKYKEKYQPKVDDVLVCNIGTIGKSIRISKDDKFLIAWNLFLIQLDLSKLHSQYFAHYLNYLADRNYFDQFLTGGTVKFITKKTMGIIEIPLPPLATQQKIAAILDAADELRQKDKGLVAKYDELTQALFLDMFGDPVTNPKGWEKVELKKLIKNLNAGVSVNSTDEEPNDNSVCILKTSCVYSGIFNPKQVKVIRHDEINRAKLNPTKDSIIISRMNTTELVGKSAYISKNYNNIFLPDRLWQTEKTDVQHSVLWLSYCLGHDSFMNEIGKISSGTSGSMKNISKSTFLGLTLIFPPLKLQNQFAERVKAIEEQKSIAQASALKSQELFNSLLQKAFNGELV